MTQTLTTYSPTPVSLWSKDHWSLMAYIETLCVDSKTTVGTIDNSKVRCNSTRHPMNANSSFSWRDSWGTRLKGFFEFKDRSNTKLAQEAGLQLVEHDDWDCLDDLESAGFIEILSLVNGYVQLTEEGLLISQQLREHKTKGGMFANFDYEATTSQKEATV